jgi:hypothetical protein
MLAPGTRAVLGLEAQIYQQLNAELRDWGPGGFMLQMVPDDVPTKNAMRADFQDLDDPDATVEIALKTRIVVRPVNTATAPVLQGQLPIAQPLALGIPESPAGTPANAAAAGGARLSFEVRSNGRLDPDALAFARAATFAVLDDDNGPVCCGFFIAANVAMSVFHDSKPRVGAKLKGLSFLGMSEDERETHEFTVTETYENLDFIILHRTKQRAKPCFFELMLKIASAAASTQRLVFLKLDQPASLLRRVTSI